MKHVDHVWVSPPLGKPSDILLYADNSTRDFLQVILKCNGVTIYGNGTKISSYPERGAHFKRRVNFSD